ncbi:hypothetical protein TBLA_0A03170 [Henningerozyma blattae CBS 6284]|uniref:Large ribosomal subunit protein mL38 n=1 Tax=Henningerozyma blattae (strain ATCC 34711 / CBS 6284 / DSM 70876 / NBRC 10599 / NRRL Y-10934 / UCD 77-7) TaxID=1071380 RepID=I2GVG5_HENB6|nr:hypothetical protein TBLA_0A03170 [Tetrapisispora blattae CBS 6284]CCH58117.1 hypothetical protein TBLA_0A03170 [Tetrapisispora blattae CBS 6284]
MFNRSFSLSSKSYLPGVWSNFNSVRSTSLSIPFKPTKDYILNKTAGSKPPSLKKLSNKIKYQSPEGLDEIFKLSYNYLENNAKKIYDKLESTSDLKTRENLLIQAEINNPEVQYNFQYSNKLENNPNLIDYEQPIYRYLGKKHWESYSQMLLMQRLETLHVIPDTMPTLDPKAEVNVRFPFSTGLNLWIEPGDTLSSNTTSMEPSIKIQEYDLIDTTKQLYTILIVNPDNVDIENDSYYTSLNYALTNIKLSYNDNIVDARKFTNLKQNLLVDYQPPVPEKNAGQQRFSTWVFRQKDIMNNENILSKYANKFKSNFNIRKFAEYNNLEAIGAHVWRSEWDSNVANVRNIYGMPQGRVFTRERF